MNFFRRWASRIVQKAHARVTHENERYLREAIEADVAIERLTQERDRLHAVWLAAELDIARLERRWAGHTSQCPTADVLDQEDRAKEAENR